MAFPKCQIVQLNPEEKRCVLTAKKTLIKSKMPLIDSFNKIRLGLETYGVVVSIQKYGLLLQFFNDICIVSQSCRISAIILSDKKI